MAPLGIRTSDPHLAQPGAFTPERAYAQSKLAQILATQASEEHV
jgi:hypothetical protein